MRRAKSLLRRGHYWLGLGLALPLVMLAVTGIFLNHTDGLQLSQRYTSQAWLLAIYGLQPVAPKTGYSVGDHWISHARDSLWLDDHKLAESTSRLLGAVLLDDLIAIAEPFSIGLYTQDGRRVEKMPLPARVAPIRAIAVANGRLLLRGENSLFSTDTRFSAWSDYSQAWPGSDPRQALPTGLQQRIAQKLAAHTLSWEKIVLDTHSGRLFGPWGPYVIDGVAMVTLGLAVTGCLLWVRQRRSRLPGGARSTRR